MSDQPGLAPAKSAQPGDQRGRRRLPDRIGAKHIDGPHRAEGRRMPAGIGEDARDPRVHGSVHPGGDQSRARQHREQRHPCDPDQSAAGVGRAAPEEQAADERCGPEGDDGRRPLEREQAKPPESDYPCRGRVERQLHRAFPGPQERLQEHAGAEEQDDEHRGTLTRARGLLRKR